MFGLLLHSTVRITKSDCFEAISSVIFEISYLKKKYIYIPHFLFQFNNIFKLILFMNLMRFLMHQIPLCQSIILNIFFSLSHYVLITPSGLCLLIVFFQTINGDIIISSIHISILNRYEQFFSSLFNNFIILYRIFSSF